MNDLVGIIRREDEIKTALAELEKLSERAGQCQRRGRHAPSTPAGTWPWTCATCCWCRECVAQAALERQETRGGHTRDDYPGMSPDWRKINLICALDGRRRSRSPGSRCPPMRQDLLALFDRGELKKYLTDEELPPVPAPAAAPAAAAHEETH